ncbi:hypothetical protein C5748_25725 [Phyllobacterium phragmitis]|uniref:Antirepressor protein ant N-terminal domain-containing protein n=1 Tax=Phyllobacterium phragmitis TaxID=2670329 RepID=A0A2S9IJH1_9HYPH|nr:phage antirepressor N-terminal domain-containing protein [Phyllobacterium phragmitis]PRD40667.1 hypothetical protein C5748_25725 [Phyllobacterium phragmitis]
MNAITTIPFHGTSLQVIAGDTPETTLVAMKPVVEGVGLNWEKQRIKLSSHPVLAPTVRVVPFASDGGLQETVVLPLNRIHFWLATINPKRVPDEETRSRVILFQNEAADVLFNHFFGRAIGRSHAAEHVTVTDLDAATRRAIGCIVKGIIHKELVEIIPGLVRGTITSGSLLVRSGRTAGTIWREASLPRLKGAAVWFGNRLAEMGCQIENAGRADIGGNAVRLFDPDKASVCLKNGLLMTAKNYAQERQGQRKLTLVSRRRS